MRWLILSLLVGCIDSGGPGEQGPNLLRNADFEEVDTAGWAAEWRKLDGNPDGQIVVVTTSSHSGSRALQWQMEATGDGREYWVTQHDVTPEQLRPGHRYALAGWYHVDQGGDVALNYIVRGQPNFEPELNTFSEKAQFPDVVDSWAPFRFEFTIPLDVAPETYEVSLHAMKFNTAKTRLTIDQVRLVQLAP
jgi:hypothetical protein